VKVSDEGVVENDGVRRRHVVVFVDEEKMDLTKKRQGESEVGFDGPVMRGIVPATGTFTEPVDGARPEGRALRIREKGGWKDEPVNPDEVHHISLDPL